MEKCKNLLDFDGYNFWDLINGNYPVESLEKELEKTHNPIFYLGLKRNYVPIDKKYDNINTELLDYLKDSSLTEDCRLFIIEIYSMIIKRPKDWSPLIELFESVDLEKVTMEDILSMFVQICTLISKKEERIIKLVKKAVLHMVDIYKNNLESLEQFLECVTYNTGIKKEALEKFHKKYGTPMQKKEYFADLLNESQNTEKQINAFFTFYNLYKEKSSNRLLEKLFSSYSKGFIFLPRDIEMFKKAVEIDKKNTNSSFDLEKDLFSISTNIYENNKLISNVIKASDYYEKSENIKNPYIHYLAARLTFIYSSVLSCKCDGNNSLLENAYKIINRAIEHDDSISDFYTWRLVFATKLNYHTEAFEFAKIANMDKNNVFANYIVFKENVNKENVLSYFGETFYTNNFISAK